MVARRRLGDGDDNVIECVVRLAFVGNSPSVLGHSYVHRLSGVTGPIRGGH